jgi:hypothetical protein
VCQAGANGANGPKGADGRDGRDGPNGPRTQVLTVSRSELWGAYVRPELQQLIGYTEDR